MSYAAVCEHLGKLGKGVYEYSQGKQSKLTKTDIDEGICRGLSVQWLISKNKGTNFYEQNTESKGLLSDTKLVKTGLSTQITYTTSSTSFDTTDEGTISVMSSGGLTHRTADEKYSGLAGGFADNLYTIANHVLTSTSRYYVLSISGRGGAHAMGIFRPWVFFGKGNKVNIFDPNVGEFEATGTDGISACLQGLYTLEYGGRNFNTKYALRSFT